MYYFNIIFRAIGPAPTRARARISRNVVADMAITRKLSRMTRPETLNSASINIEAQKWVKPYRRFAECLERPTLAVTACEHGGDHEGENWAGTAF